MFCLLLFTQIGLDRNKYMVTTLEALLVTYFTTEAMIDDGTQDNRLYCRYCHSKQNGKKKLIMNQSPEILVISLKRFWWEYPTNYSQNGKRHKIFSPVQAPFLLDLSQYNIGNCKYMLMGVAVHSGDADYGHYFSMTRTADDIAQHIQHT